MSLSTRVDALAARIAVAIKALQQDPRWTDARTPTAHAGSHAAAGSDPITPAAIGAATDSAVVHTSGAETINGVKTFGSAPVIPLGGQDANPVRRDDPRLADARTPSPHAESHGDGGSDELALDASQITTGTVDAQRLPRNGWQVGAATLTGTNQNVNVDASSGSGPKAVNLTLQNSGTTTINVPTNGVDQQIVKYNLRADGGARTVALNAGIVIPPTLTGGQFVIPSGGFLCVEIQYSSLLDTWVLRSTSDHVHGPKIIPLANVGAGGTITADAAAGPTNSIFRVTTTGSTATLGVPANPSDGYQANVEVLANTALTLTINASIQLTGGAVASIPVAAGKRWFGLLRYVTGVGWFLLGSSAQA